MTEARLGVWALIAAATLLGCAQAGPAAEPPLISSGLHFREPAPVPLQPIQPRHPNPASSTGGWCIVQMDVDPSGVSRDHRLVDCDPRAIFEEAALAAARELRYRQSADGYRDVQYRVEF